MATDQHYKVPYPRAQAGPQVYDGRIHGMATIQGGHRPNLTHSATSAFRPAVMPHVPLQQRLVSPGVIPSNREQYHQQQTVPCGSSGKRAMHLELQQKQQRQQHLFQNLPSTSPVNRFQEISLDMHPRAALNSVVQAVTPVEYRPSLQQYRAVQESSDREILHQELRMLHAVHYQDMNRKDELMETYLKQKLDDEKKQRSQAALAHHVMYDTQRKPHVLSDTVYRKKFIEDAHVYGHQPQRMYLPKQEELYQSRKARVPMGVSLASSASQMMSHTQTHPEMRVRLDGAMPQSVPQAHLVQGIKENTSATKNYHSYQIKERYGAHQQYQTRLPAQGATMQHLHVQHTHPEVFQTRRKQRSFPPQLQAANLVHPAVQHRPQKEQNSPLQYYQDIVMVEDDMEQVPVISHIGQLKQERNVDKKASVDGSMHSLSGQLLKDRMCEDEKNYVVDDDSKESRRLSKVGVSIREEQMQLKEALVKSLHKAAVQNSQKEAKENTRDFTSHIVASSAGDIESMPRIVEVRSLANQEAAPVVHRDATKGNIYGVPQGDVIGTNLKPSKPKSIMIKSHQELQEVPVNVNRVPSIGSMDSDNGRKDSWDSGIESPPWPENREACIMNMKRAAPFPCDDIALNSPHQVHRLKLVEKKQSDNSTGNVGIDLPAKDQINVPSDRIPPVKEGFVASRGNVAFCSPSPEALHGSRQLSNEEKRIVSGGPLRSVNRKRSWPVDDVCPVENKVLSRDPQASNYSSLRRGSVPEEEMISKEKMAVKSQPVETIIVENESPLDLSCKKDQEETSSEIKEVKETPLDENEVIIEKKPNVNEVSEDKGDDDNEVKKGVKCDGEEKNLTDTASNEADERVSMSSDSPMQGYFCNLMMQTLKRIWSESKAKLDVHDAAKDKSECVESSDEDSGKYFQPSSVTTLKQVPRVDSPDGLLLPVEDDPDKNMLPSSSSSHSLETALCLLMRQSSDAFKHGGDIFQHFDKMIKQELKVEIEKQLRKGNEDSTATETKQKDDPSASNSSDHSEVKPDEQTSEAVAVCSKNPNNVLSEEEIDDSQNLVIVESSISPKPSPDSQITEDKMEKVLVPAVISTVCEKPSPIAADSSVCESFTSPGQMYEKAARDAAQKAAHEAARLAAQKAAQASLATKEEGLSQAQSKPQYVGEVIEKEVTSVETSLPQKPSPVTSSVQINPKPVMYTGVQGHPRINFHQVQNSGRACIASVKQPHSCPQRPQYMGEELPSSTIEEEDAKYRPLHPSAERRYSEPAIFNQNNTDKPQKIQRMQSSDTSSKLSVRNGQNVGPSSEKPSVGNTYRIIPQSVWQAQTQEPNSNKVRLMRVTSVPNKPVITLPGVPNAQDIQKQLQKSPIVLLPKLVCVPGQTYSQPTPIVGTQTYQTGNMVILQNDNVQNVTSAAPVISSATVQVTASSAAHQSGSNAPVQNHTPEKAQSPELLDTIKGPFRIIQKTPIDQTSPAKKACVSAFIIIYKKISLPGVLRSGVPFVPPRLLQDGMFPDETFEDFCHALQDCNIMQRYMTVLERSALLNDLKHNKISSCKLVSLEEFHQKYDNIKVLIQVSKMT